MPTGVYKIFNWLKQIFTCVYGIFSCHDSTATWRANWWHIVVVQDHSIVCQTINIRSRNLLWAMKTHIIPALKKWKKRRKNTTALLYHFYHMIFLLFHNFFQLLNSKRWLKCNFSLKYPQTGNENIPTYRVEVVNS